MRSNAPHIIRVILRSCLYAIVPVILMIAFFVWLNPSGFRHLEYHVGAPTPLISQFFPAQRLRKPENGMQVVQQQPVYFTVRYPHRYDSAVVRIALDNPTGIDWSIGLAVGSGSEWAYSVQKPDEKGTALFSLSNAQVRDGRLRFMLAAPTSSVDKSLTLRGVSVDLKRESFVETLRRRLFDS